MKTLPTKLVAVKKKKPNEPIKRKSRIVACGNYDESEEKKVPMLEVQMQPQ